MSARKSIPAGILLLASAAALATDDDLPDEGFLEYLGSWEESDEDWLMFERDSRANKRKGDDSESNGEEEESAETQDES